MGRRLRGAGAKNEEPPTGTMPLRPQHHRGLSKTMELTLSGGGSSSQRSWKISGGCNSLGALLHPYKSLSFEVVALFQGQGKGDGGRTPRRPHSGRIGDRAASPISRSNKKLPRSSKLPLLPPLLGKVQSSDGFCSQLALTHLPVSFFGKGTANLLSKPPLHAGTPSGRPETQVGAPRTLPESPAPLGKGALSPTDL